MRNGRGAAGALRIALAHAVAIASIAAVTMPSTAAAGTQTNVNACQMSVNGLFANVDITMSGTAVAINPSQIDLAGLTIGATIPDAVHLELYSLGYHSVGINPMGVTAAVTISASNTVEGSRTVVGTTLQQVQITDPDGIKRTGDETAVASPPISVLTPAATWTPTGGEMIFTQTAAAITTSHFFGTVTATLTCAPGSTPDGTTVVPAVPVPFEAIIPPTAPTCLSPSVISGPGSSTEVDIPTLCFDINGDLDPASVQITAGPAGGTASVSSAGVITYTNTVQSIGSDSIEATIADATGLVSLPLTITLLVQPLRVMEQGGSEVTMSAVTLDGGAQVATGDLNSITITNLPTSGLGFTVSAYATDLGAPEVPETTLDLNGDGTPDVSVPTCDGAGPSARLCIPAENLGWSPRAIVVDDGGAGGAAVQAGPASATSAEEWLALLSGATPAAGLSQPQMLCTSPVAEAVGTFRCDADLFLGVPASAGESSYRGLIVVTII